jgi:hypothetical protein
MLGPDLTAHEAALLGYLSHHDIPCPRCEYNLRDLPALLCPECGLEVTWSALLDRRVSVKQRLKTAATALGVVAAAAVTTAILWDPTPGIAVGAFGPLVLAWFSLARWAWPFISAPGVPPDLRIWRAYIALVRAFCVFLFWFILFGFAQRLINP